MPSCRVDWLIADASYREYSWEPKHAELLLPIPKNPESNSQRELISSRRCVHEPHFEVGTAIFRFSLKKSRPEPPAEMVGKQGGHLQNFLRNLSNDPIFGVFTGRTIVFSPVPFFLPKNFLGLWPRSGLDILLTFPPRIQ